IEGAITDQGYTGRCWIFANLNMFRPQVMRALNLDPKDDFTLDTNFIYFYDKLERASFWLNRIIDTIDKPIDSKDAKKVLKSPTPAFDGGIWNWLQNLVMKYGLIPAGTMQGSKSAQNSHELREQLEKFMIACAIKLRATHEIGSSREEL